MSAVAVLAFQSKRCEASGCPINIPASHGRYCYFHSRPDVPKDTSRTWHDSRADHVRKHLRVEDRQLVDHLLLPITLDEIALRLGAGWTRGMVERGWLHIRYDLGIVTGHKGNPGAIERLTLVRIVAGMQPCFCGA